MTAMQRPARASASKPPPDVAQDSSEAHHDRAAIPHVVQLSSAPLAGDASAAPTRLYVGNLAASVDEYALLKAFERFGKLKKLDFLFHKTGPQRGQPRGYAFIEYEQASDAAKALNALTSRAGATLRGRRLTVAYASERPEFEVDLRHRRHLAAPDEHRTALSATLAASTPLSVEARIAQMEAQLASIEGKSQMSGVSPRGKGERIRPSGHTRLTARNSTQPYKKRSSGNPPRRTSGS